MCCVLSLRTLYDIRISYDLHFATGAEPQVSQNCQVYGGHTSKQNNTAWIQKPKTHASFIQKFVLQIKCLNWSTSFEEKIARRRSFKYNSN